MLINVFIVAWAAVAGAGLLDGVRRGTRLGVDFSSSAGKTLRRASSIDAAISGLTGGLGLGVGVGFGVGVGGGKAACGGGVTRGAGGGGTVTGATGGELLAAVSGAVGAATGVSGLPSASFLGKSRDKMLIESLLPDQARPVEVSNSAGNDGKEFLCDSQGTVAVHCQCHGNIT